MCMSDLVQTLSASCDTLEAIAARAHPNPCSAQSGGVGAAAAHADKMQAAKDHLAALRSQPVLHTTHPCAIASQMQCSAVGRRAMAQTKLSWLGEVLAELDASMEAEGFHEFRTAAGALGL